MISSKFFSLPGFQNFRFRALSTPKRMFSARENAVTCRSEKGGARPALVLGVYSVDTDITGTMFNLTKTASRFNTKTDGKLVKALTHSGTVPKLGETRILQGITDDFSTIAMVGLGRECLGYDDYEEMDLFKETIRNCVGAACRFLQDQRVPRISIESFGHAESAAEGAALSTWVYQTFRNPNNRLPIPLIDLYDDCDLTGWKIGLTKAEAQNFARELTDTPSNFMTPTSFAQNAVEILCKSGVNVEVKVEGWAETQNMGAFLGVSKGSCEPPIFLELSYYGTDYDVKPIILVGKGVTFNSGGVCLRSPQEMQYMRGDMAGGAVVVAVARAIASLNLPVNIRGLIPLCENMPGCDAYKPGDVLTAMNGKDILIEDTDCEGELVLSDALHYAKEFNPQLLIDIGTMTDAVYECLGTAAAGAFSTSEEMWERLHRAGVHTGDRVWRLPLWDLFRRQITDPAYGDVANVGWGNGGGGCKTAAFLREFAPNCDWVHLDTHGILRTDGKELQYLRPGMTGRPTRTLIEFISEMTCVKCDDEKS